MNTRNRWQLGALIWLCVWGVGCQQKPEIPSAPGQTEPSPPLRVLIVDRERWGNEIERRWNADAQTPIDVEFVTEAEFSIDKINGYDVVIYPGSWTAALADADAILRLDERRFESEDWNAKDVLPLESGTRVRWGEEIVGVSLGHAPWVLAYRESRLEPAELTALRDWRGFDGWLQTRMGTERASGGPGTILGLPLKGTDGAEVFLARAGANVRHRGAFSGFFDLGQTRPLLTTEPFVVAMTWFSSPAILPGEPSVEECWGALLQGKLDVAILPLPIRGETDELESLAGETPPDESSSRAIGDLRFLPLPGSERVFISGSGWRERGTDESHVVPYLGSHGTLASIPKESRRAGAAWGFLQWLASGKAQLLWAEVATEAFPTRYSSLGSVHRWLPEGLSEAAIDDVVAIVRSDQEQSVAMSPLRVPSAPAFLTSIADAVRAVRAGAPPQQALDDSQRSWEEAIEQIGSEVFRRQHEQGLGL